MAGSSYMMREDIFYIRRRTIRAAQDLGYPKEVIQKLMEAKTEREMSNIMKSARKGRIK